MITQIISGLAVIALFFMEWKVYKVNNDRRKFHQEQERVQAAAREQEWLASEHQRLELEARQAALDFHRLTTQELQVAIMQGANYKVQLGNPIEVSYPQQARTQVTEEQQKQFAAPQLVAAGIRQPTQRYLIDQLEENALQASPGIRTSDGAPIILSIPDAVHFKLIGSSGFGKSCLAAAILDQAVRLNRPDVLHIVLLDLEHKTSRLFENSPNIEQMLKDLSVLAIRARKYNMFLLACAQTDYSTPELKTAQKQFKSRIAFAIDTTAARAAGFMSTELIKYSFSHSQPGDGMYVLETPVEQSAKRK